MDGWWHGAYIYEPEGLWLDVLVTRYCLRIFKYLVLVLIIFEHAFHASFYVLTAKASIDTRTSTVSWWNVNAKHWMTATYTEARMWNCSRYEFFLSAQQKEETSWSSIWCWKTQSARNVEHRKNEVSDLLGVPFTMTWYRIFLIERYYDINLRHDCVDEYLWLSMQAVFGVTKRASSAPLNLALGESIEHQLMQSHSF